MHGRLGHRPCHCHPRGGALQHPRAGLAVVARVRAHSRPTDIASPIAAERSIASASRKRCGPAHGPTRERISHLPLLPQVSLELYTPRCHLTPDW
eukprot:6800079-Prymnesium_polylepis.5